MRTIYNPALRYGLAAACLQVADATSTGDEEAVKRKTAKHELLDAQGNVVDNEEEANGTRYTLIAVPQRPFEYQYGENPAMDKMLAIFGAKTLATNESSAIRNNPKGAGTPEEQIDAVIERFALVKTGKWVDRTRDGVGATIDLDVLANAICNVQVARGIYTEEQVKAEKMAATRALLEDKTKVTAARKVPEFAAEYARLKGAVAVSADDFKV